MAKIDIPQQVIPGFKLLAELNDEKINSLQEYLYQIDYSTKFKEIGKFLETLVGESNSQLLFITITSFSELLGNDFGVETVDLVVQNLLDSYIEITKEDKIEVTKTLKSKLTTILISYQKLKTLIDSRDVAFENENIFRSSNINTDIRLLTSQKDIVNHVGIVLQKLKIEYSSKYEKKIIYLTLDLEDLNDLKQQIEDAITIENNIRIAYKDTFNLI